MNILIIESERSVASLFCDTIADWGHNVEYALSGQNALDKLKKKAYHVVIIDTSLPGMRAADLISRLKEIIPKTDIVVMTKHNTARLERSMRRLGVIYYMTQLAPTEDLRNVLEHIS